MNKLLQIKNLLIAILLISTNNFVDGQIDHKDGPIQIFYPNGQVASEGIIKNGKPDGYWKTYYVTGVVKSVGKRTNFLLDSTWNFYNQSGELVEIINYKNGKRSGYSLKYVYNNPDRPGKKTLISKELYINDIKEGNSIYYFNTGELKEIIYYSNGKRQGYAKEYNKDGVVITLKQFKDNYLISRERINRVDDQGLKQGTYKTFFEDGSLKKEENYLDNQLHGYYREFDEKGALLQTFRYERGAIIEEIDEEAQDIIDFRRTFDENGNIIFSGGYKDGTPIGIHRFFDTTGEVVNAYIYNEKGVKLSEGIVDEEGNKRGEWKNLYPDGAIRSRGIYRNNKKSGEWIYYFKNGNVEQKGDFLNGRFDGLWLWYYSTGELWREENYFNGLEDGSSVEYDENGNVLARGNYINGEKNGKWISDVGDYREEGEYIIGLKEGKWVHYYDNGTPSFIGKYTQGLPDGKQVYYYEDGSIKEEQYYDAGVREKTWRKYDKLGNTEIAISYKNNVEIRINGIKVRLPEGDIKVIN